MIRDEVQGFEGDPYQYRFTLIEGDGHTGTASGALIEKFIERMYGG